MAIVGIHSGGAWLAERLARDLNLLDRLGVLDVSFYRDDFAQKGLHADVKPTQISFDVAGATILLVDDVLYTPRARPSMNCSTMAVRPRSCWPPWSTAASASCRWPPISWLPVPAGQALVLKQADDGKFTLTLDTHHA